MIRFKIVLLSLVMSLSSLIASEQYVCTSDPTVHQYQEGAINADAVTKYQYTEQCENACREYEVCQYKPIDEIQSFPSSGGYSGAYVFERLQAAEIQNGLPTISTKYISLQKDEVVQWEFEDDTPFSVDITFPHIDDDFDDFSAWSSTASNKFTLSNGDYIEFKHYIVQDGTIQIVGDNTNDVNIYLGSKKYKVNAEIDGIYYDMNGSSGSEYKFEFKNELTAYRCDMLGAERLGGDLDDGRAFSNQDTCNERCYIQNPCAEWIPDDCEVVDVVYEDPVTDWTGKTLFTKARVVKKCFSTVTRQTGCAKWQIEDNQGNLKYNLDGVGKREKVYSGQDDAMVQKKINEALQDITGAWEGQCEVGTTFDNPFEDPMKLLSYAMMTYSSAADGSMDDALGTGSDIQDSVTSAENYVTSAFDSSATDMASAQEASQVNKGLYDAFENGDISASEYKAAINSVANTTEKVVQDSWWETLADMDEIVSFDNPFFSNHEVVLKMSDIIATGLSVVDLDEEKMQKADQFMKSWMGDPSATDQNALAYASCMASIGLSFPNVVSSSINDEHGASPALNMPWDKPLRLSKKQLELLADATSESYADTAYRIAGQSGNLYNVFAWDDVAYQQAGQVLCAGTMSKAMNVRQSMLTDNLNPSGGNQTQQIGMAVARMLIQNLVPPPYNIIATMVFDIITSIGSIDACNNMEDAMQHGSLKVMQHKNFNQCYRTRSECAEKWFWGDCMRDRNFYCCFSTIETRIVAQAINQQLCKDNSSCGGIGIQHLKMISFVPCEEGQSPCTDKCFPRDKYAEFFNQMTKGASKDMDGDMDGIMNQIKDMMSTERGMCE